MSATTDIHDALHALTRWTHVVAAVLWLGQLYFLEFIHRAVMGALDRETRTRVVPELLPRVLFWFRWGAAWTWGSGAMLLSFLYWEGPYFAQSGAREPGAALAAFFVLVLLFAVYELITRALARRAFIALWIWYAAAFAYAWTLQYAPFFAASNRAIYVHVGALLGTTMAANTWIHIWPARRRIVEAIVAGNEPDPADVDRAESRSRHNAFMSLPVVFLMLSAHETLIGVSFGEPWMWLPGLFAVGFLTTLSFYLRSRHLKGLRA